MQYKPPHPPYPDPLIFSQNLVNRHTAARAGFSFPNPNRRRRPHNPPSTSQQLNLRTSPMTLTLSSSAGHSTPRNRTSSGFGRARILTSKNCRLRSLSSRCDREARAGATTVSGRTCRRIKSVTGGRRSSLLRSRDLMSCFWSLRWSSYWRAWRWGWEMMLRRMRSRIAGRRGRKEFMRLGQWWCRRMSWRWGSVARRRRRCDVCHVRLVGGVQWIKEVYEREGVEFGDVEAQENVNEDLVREMVDRAHRRRETRHGHLGDTAMMMVVDV